MHEQRRRPGRGDIRGPAHGDFSGEGFSDWDNPEDEEREDAPEGYYDDEDEEWEEIGPDDPDYDLSEEAGYSDWEPRRAGGSIVPQWVIVAVSLLLILAVLVPMLLTAR